MIGRLALASRVCQISCLLLLVSSQCFADTVVQGVVINKLNGGMSIDEINGFTLETIPNAADVLRASAQLNCVNNKYRMKHHLPALIWSA